jgi:hypothetical protein
MVYGLHKTGRDIDTIKSRFGEIEKCLDPKCLAFLQSGGGNVSSFISDLLSNNLVAAGDIVPETINAFSYLGKSGQTNVPDGYAAIVVNDTGAFFSITSNTDNGRLTGGTPRAQAFILLHELAHALNAKGFKNDLNDPDAQKANNKLIENNCNDTLKQFAK